MFVCLFVYFYQLSVTMNNNKVEGSNRDKTMKKQNMKEKFTPFTPYYDYYVTFHYP